MRILFPVIVSMAGLTLTWETVHPLFSTQSWGQYFGKIHFGGSAEETDHKQKLKQYLRVTDFFYVRVHKVNQAHPDRRAHRALPLQLLKASSSHLMITRGMSRLQKMWSSSKMLPILLRWTKTKHFPTGEIPSCVPTRESTPRWRLSGDIC